MSQCYNTIGLVQSDQGSYMLNKKKQRDKYDKAIEYFLKSLKIKEELGFVAQHTIREASEDLKNAFEKGLLPDSFENEMYFNIKRMQSVTLQ